MQLQNFQLFFQPGIYMIKNTINKKRYYGQTGNLALRFAQHYRELKVNVHQARSLQQDWVFFGADVFTWEIIEIGEQ
jgi:predicted GIY-YIG superfamily endonuclease